MHALLIFASCMQPLINVKGFDKSQNSGGVKRLQRKAKQRRKAASKVAAERAAAVIGAAEEESISTADGDTHVSR